MMDNDYEKNEKFREKCYNGDLESIQKYHLNLKPDLNSRNKVNGWTALHWAAKQGHISVVHYLISNGAEIHIKDNNGKSAGQYATNSQIREILLSEKDLGNFEKITESIPLKDLKPINKSVNGTQKTSEESVITIRLKEHLDEDFIEIDIDRFNLTLEDFKKLCYKELDHISEDRSIVKIRKLPNILIRNDNDIRRLKNEQEIEIIFQ